MRFLVSPGNDSLPSFWALLLPSLASDPLSESRLASSSPDSVNGALLHCPSEAAHRHLPTLPLSVLTSQGELFPYTLGTLCWASMPSAPCFSFLHTHLTQMPFSVKPSPTTLASAPQNFRSLISVLLGFYFVPPLPRVGEWFMGRDLADSPSDVALTLGPLAGLNRWRAFIHSRTPLIEMCFSDLRDWMLINHREHQSIRPEESDSPCALLGESMISASWLNMESLYMKSHSVLDKIMVLQRCLCPNSWNLWTCSIGKGN